ncbi:hypothetical protein H112_08259 [Trichophyton rubrum D6]|uniref:Uncharacterized protein n=2 Tax=Trichophyton TaxID=5550 RepID=A0A022VPP5_TRIRU|nr:hypothetical protein H100_08283 [Trichophyton rubrum MR850]EZF37290.1 hypothetical protein H102_08242 [Trichophyton rubrum CBS 100081]EZF47914.1 hypothetical protein H103_08265 [Trichophyton rubrum CBS 288.86]EZF58634.1 hypothetical protein H104_08216 [Trichophyton rubrum CBS 289.86]EZF69246.1 hypothetical protein H105_08269 [Trichophyton soudanense CBS 452.61]EZF79917.1 hypothetical protein H110_08264 [Trichophyton rubrum MR1448]EZF90557.1 hypothetical protein H113_08333 [Trichophyton rub
MEHRGQDEELAVSVSGLNARRHADKDISLASFTSRYLLNRAHHNLINQHLTQHSGWSVLGLFGTLKLRITTCSRLRHLQDPEQADSQKKPQVCRRNLQPISHSLSFLCH